MAVLSSAQNARITSKLDTNIILIGDQIKFSLSVEHMENASFTWPLFADTIVEKIEIVRELSIDTIQSKGLMIETKHYLITSFDSGFHVIPPINVSIVSDGNVINISSEPLLLTVKLIDLVEGEDIRDIKQPIDTPITWLETLQKYWKVMLLVLMIIGGAVGFWLGTRKRDYVKKVAKQIVIPDIAPEVTALTELNKIKDEKRWLEKSTKPYFSELTNTIRVYISGTFHINAMEMTTEEIIICLQRTQITAESKSKLTYLLMLADEVKFAKQKPLIQECELCLNNALEFVNNTKPMEEEVVSEPATTSES
ncbi:MAG: hypothetical protein HRT71_08475 [Flavobacteriales bacterium]|nr:hypothetical protein [Flavobacteriales bacterium]